MPRVPERLLTTETAEDLNVKAVKRGYRGWGGQRTSIKMPQWGAGTLSIKGLQEGS